MEPVQFYRVQRICLPSKIQAENVFEKIRDGLDFMQALNRYKSRSAASSQRGYGLSQAVLSGFPVLAERKTIGRRRTRAPQKRRLLVCNPLYRKKEGDDVANFEDFKAEIRHKILLEKQEDVYRQLLRETKAQAGKVFYY